MNWDPYLRDIYYNFSVIMPDGKMADVKVFCHPIDSSGYHLKIYCMNRLIGDCVHPDEPGIKALILYCKQFLDNPVKYGNETIVIDDHRQ